MLKITCDCGAIALLPGETTSPVKSPFEETKFNPMPPPSNVSECHCRNCTNLEGRLEAAQNEIRILTAKVVDADRAFYRMRDERDREIARANQLATTAEAWRADYQKLKDQILGMAGRL